MFQTISNNADNYLFNLFGFDQLKRITEISNFGFIDMVYESMWVFFFFLSYNPGNVLFYLVVFLYSILLHVI